MTRHIKVVGKTLPRIDPLKLAKALGADTMIGAPKQAKDGRYYMEYTLVKKNGCATKRRIYQLDENSVKKYTLLGTANGSDFHHCLLLSGKYVKDCRKRICGYYIKTPIVFGCKIAVSFYAKK